MEESSTTTTPRVAEAAIGGDGLSIKRWLMAYAAWLAVLVTSVTVLLGRMGHAWADLFVSPRQFFTTPEHAPLKLLIYAIYLSVSCTVVPLHTGWLVSALATRSVALSASLLTTTVLVATVGAIGSTIANIHDYHLFTWMLRHKRVARIRNTKAYRRAERWFARQPFALVVAFNILPIPIDVVRMLAATYRYPLRQFAAANFMGRWIRYAAIAAATFALGQRGWWMVVALLAVAIALAAPKLADRIRARRARRTEPAGGG